MNKLLILTSIILLTGCAKPTVYEFVEDYGSPSDIEAYSDDNYTMHYYIKRTFSPQLDEKTNKAYIKTKVCSRAFNVENKIVLNPSNNSKDCETFELKESSPEVLKEYHKKQIRRADGLKIKKDINEYLKQHNKKVLAEQNI